MTIELIPLEGLPEVEPGDDLAALLEPWRAPTPPPPGTATS
jgi:F420-0:gamma-glutamyl ligase